MRILRNFEYGIGILIRTQASFKGDIGVMQIGNILNPA
jgi:hypothetical protein